MGATFVGTKKPRITLFSRTSYIGYIGLLDAGIAHVMAREIANEFEDVSVKDIALTWHLTSAQLHHFKSLPYLYSTFPKIHDELHRHKSKRTTMGYIAKWQSKIEEAYDTHGTDMLEFEKYGPFKRIKRRWMEHEGIKGTPPPSCLIDSLTFEKAQ